MSKTCGMAQLLTEYGTLMRQIEAQRRQAVEEARAVACPHCDRVGPVATWQGFIEPGKGFTERMIATCPCGWSWAVADPTFIWEGQNAVDKAR